MRQTNMQLFRIIFAVIIFVVNILLLCELGDLVRELGKMFCELRELLRELGELFCELGELLRELGELLRELGKMFGE